MPCKHKMQKEACICSAHLLSEMEEERFILIVEQMGMVVMGLTMAKQHLETAHALRFPADPSTSAQRTARMMPRFLPEEQRQRANLE